MALWEFFEVLEDALGADAFAVAWEAGAALSPEQAIAEATAPGTLTNLIPQPPLHAMERGWG